MSPDRPLKKKRARPAAPETEAEAVVADRGVAPRKNAPLPRTGMPSITALAQRWFDAPEPVLRIELIRILAPLATLGFMSSRLAHADEWLTHVGFQVPPMDVPDYRQPLYLEPLSINGAWVLAVVMVASGLAVSAGFRARIAALIFAVALGWVALQDRLAAFTVSKLSPAVMLALAASPCGSRLSVDAWLKKKRDPKAKLPRWVAASSVRFFQVLLPVFYCGSAVAKAKGGWLREGLVLWSHTHDSYQSAFTWALANALPGWMWTLFQAVVFALEMGAPLWFALRRTRPWALMVAVIMHTMIGLMFWPVRWFSLLMITMWCGAFLPEEWLERAERRLTGI
jgi:hypothetical protein